MSAPDEIIHQSTRLKIMSALNAMPRPEMLEFVRLRAVAGATDGNLGAHLTTLEKAGYVKIVKDFVDDGAPEVLKHLFADAAYAGPDGVPSKAMSPTCARFWKATAATLEQLEIRRWETWLRIAAGMGGPWAFSGWR